MLGKIQGAGHCALWDHVLGGDSEGVFQEGRVQGSDYEGKISSG